MPKNKELLAYYGPFYRAVWRFLRLFSRRYRAAFTPPAMPTVYVARHRNARVPMRIMLDGAIPRLRVWVLGLFFDRDACQTQYRTYTFPKVAHIPAFLCPACAAIAARPIVRLMHDMKAIPVHRGSRRIIETLRDSCRALDAGENLLILPERDYLGQDEQNNEIYTGFLHLAQLRARQGHDTNFAVLLVDDDASTITLDAQLCFRAGQKDRAQLQQLQDMITAALRQKHGDPHA